MANPDFVDEGVADQGGSASVTASFPTAWAANQIALWFIATDGAVPVLSTPNGFVLATDPNGNVASVTTNGGTAGNADCAMFVFWRRLAGSTTTTDPAPVLAAPASWGGTVFASELNTYSGCRTTGTPFHIVATAIVGTATTTIAPPAVTPTLAGCTVLAMAASANDDATFNPWTFAGAAAPTGQLDTGWHSPTANTCAFTGGRGGYATVGGARSGSSSFGAATKQAQIVLVLASLPEAFGRDEEQGPRPTLAAPPAWVATGAPAASFEELPVAVVASVLDEDVSVLARPLDPQALGRSSAWSPPSVEEMQGQASAATIVDDDPLPTAIPGPARPAAGAPSPQEEIGSGVQPSGFDEEATAIPAPLVPIATSPPRAVVVDEIAPTQLVAAVAAGGDIQRSFSAPPQSGTLTTIAPIPAWAPSTAYVVDPTAGGINRVANGGNLYQCSTPGTSASSGGPTGTSTNITDGTAHWYYVGPVLGTDTIAGSQVLAAVMRGNQAQAASIDPTDNDGGAFTLITNNEYGAFAGSFAGVWYRSAAANAKSNYTVSAVFGGSGGAGDELSAAWARLNGVVAGAPHASSHVERLSASGGTVTAAPITITKRCLIVSFWFGNGTVQAAGAPDTAAPTGGLTLIANASAPLSLTTAGYIQHMVAWRIADPGTSAEVWTATTNEGAQLVTVAFETTSTGSIMDDDVGVTAIPVRPWALGPAAAPPPAAEELPVAPIDEEAPRPWPQLVTWSLGATPSEDELPATAVVDDDSSGMPPILAVAPQAARPAADEEMSAAPTILDDDAGPGAPAPGVDRSIPMRATPGDEVPSQVVDEAGWSFAIAWTPPLAPGLVISAEEMPVAVPPPPGPGIDDDPLVAAAPYSTPSLPLFAPTAADELPMSVVPTPIAAVSYGVRVVSHEVAVTFVEVFDG